MTLLVALTLCLAEWMLLCSTRYIGLPAEQRSLRLVTVGFYGAAMAGIRMYQAVLVCMAIGGLRGTLALSMLQAFETLVSLAILISFIRSRRTLEFVK